MREFFFFFWLAAGSKATTTAAAAAAPLQSRFRPMQLLRPKRKKSWVYRAFECDVSLCMGMKCEGLCCVCVCFVVRAWCVCCDVVCLFVSCRCRGLI